MTQQPHGGGAPPSRKTWWIAALLALLVVALAVWLMSRAGRDDNLTPDAVALDPNTGGMTATGTAALDATGTDTGAPGTPGVYNEDSPGGTTPRSAATDTGTGATGAVTPSGARVAPTPPPAATAGAGTGAPVQTAPPQ